MTPTVEHAVEHAVFMYFRRNPIPDPKYHQENLHAATMAMTEKPLVKAVMKHTAGNKRLAAKILGINRGTLIAKLKQHDIT